MKWIPIVLAMCAVAPAQETERLRQESRENAAAVANLPVDAERSRQRAARKRRDIGVAGSVNFTVYAPKGGHFAGRVLEQAERYRREIAREWLGAELPRGAEFTHISVKINDDNQGLTLLCGPGKKLPGDNRMWIDGTRELATGEILAHEVCHVVLNSVGNGKLAKWAHEGISSRYDDPENKAPRIDRLNEYREQRGFPSVATVMGRDQIRTLDEYTVSESLVAFLLTKGSRETLLEFAVDGRAGWNAALREHYGIENTAALQREWARWAMKRPIVASR